MSSVCELGEQLCHQDRAMSCTPSVHIPPLIWECISQIFCPRRRGSEQIFFLCLDQEMDVWWGLVSVYSPHPHLTTYCLFSEFVKGKHCAVNLTSPFKEAERKQLGHSRVGKTENCCLVKRCTWTYSYRLLGPELRQVGKVVILHYKWMANSYFSISFCISQISSLLFLLVSGFHFFCLAFFFFFFCLRHMLKRTAAETVFPLCVWLNCV